MTLQLRFDAQEISGLAKRYCEGMSPQEEALMGLRTTQLRAQGLDRQHLAQVAQWKSLRRAASVLKNDNQYVRELTHFALTTPVERARIEVLTLLDGVGWPTASVILHFYHSDPYPILDIRALWAVGADLTHKYDFEFWMEYVQFCRTTATQVGVDMRTLDRALWQYSKENQAFDF